MNRHALNRATTLALAQQLHAIRPSSSPRRRVGRIPKPQQPRAIENSYHATLVRLVCDVARDCFDRHAPEILRAMVEQRRAQGILEELAPEERHDAGDGVMVGLWLPLDVAQRLAVPGGEAPVDMHITLVYLGKREMFAPAQLEQIRDAVAKVARDFAPLSGELSGLGRFMAGPEDVFHASADVPGASAMREALVGQLKANGIAIPGAHGFDPHVTIAYLDRVAPAPLNRVEALPLHFGALTLAIAGSRTEIPLVGLRFDARGKGGGRRGGKPPPVPPSVYRGGAIGFGRAAQLGREQAKKEQAEIRARAVEVDRELRSASEQGKRAAAAVDRAARDFAEVFRPQALHDVVLQFGKATDRHSRLQLDQQLRSAIGVPLSAIERPFRDQLDEWAALNVDLIVTVPERYFDRLRLDILDAFEGGTHPSTLAEDFQERYEMSDRDAERIARDQVLSLQADLNQERMTSLGVEEYVWRTANDGRVRENHAALEGARCRWDDPPMGGGTGPDEPGNVGSGILCRCYAEPVLDDLVGR